MNDEIDNVIAFKEITIVDYKEPRLTIISADFNNVDKTMKHEEGFHVSSEIDWDFFYFNCIDDVKTTYTCEIQNQGGPCTTYLYLLLGNVDYYNGWIDTNGNEYIKKLADEKFGAGETRKFVFDIDLSLQHERLFGVSISTNTSGRPYNPISIYSALEPLLFTNDRGQTLKAKRNYGECIAYCTGNTNSIENTTADGGIEIKNANGAITVTSNHARHLSIYHISGSKVSDVYLSANIPTTLSLPAGMYIVNGRKIVVNVR